LDLRYPARFAPRSAGRFQLQLALSGLRLSSRATSRLYSPLPLVFPFVPLDRLRLEADPVLDFAVRLAELLAPYSALRFAPALRSALCFVLPWAERCRVALRLEAEPGVRRHVLDGLLPGVSPGSGRVLEQNHPSSARLHLEVETSRRSAWNPPKGLEGPRSVAVMSSRLFAIVNR
jgi:hypothetical protein